MSTISINAAWNEASAFVKREPRVLFLIAFGLIALPSVIVQALAPQTGTAQAPQPGPWMLMVIPMIVLSVLGTLTITVLALGRASNAADAFSIALRRCLPVLGALLLFGFGAALLIVPIIVFLALTVQNLAVLASLSLFAVAAALLILWVRMMLMMAVGAAEAGGPTTILRRSWRLTAGNSGRLLIFVLLMFVMLMVLTIVVTSLGGILIVLVAGPPSPGSLGSVLLLLLSGVVSAGFAVYFNAMLAAIYRQLTAEPAKGI